MIICTLCALVLGTPAAYLRADDTKDTDARLKEFLGKIEGSDVGRTVALTTDGLPAAFPDFVLYSYVIPQFPVGRPAPAPLASATVIAVPKKKDGKPVLITDLKQLEKFFAESAAPVAKAPELEAAIKSWLRCAAELNQDGYFKFTVKAGKFTASSDGTSGVDGATTVDPANGDKGGITAKLTFKDGKLATAETNVNLMAGMRPRCQATKLLDPDPIVRAMAADSLRVMGSGVRPYLDEQRAKAPAALRVEIDRVWARIVAERR